jgi:hypothetical protein
MTTAGRFTVVRIPGSRVMTGFGVFTGIDAFMDRCLWKHRFIGSSVFDRRSWNGFVWLWKEIQFFFGSQILTERPCAPLMHLLGPRSFAERRGVPSLNIT